MLTDTIHQIYAKNEEAIKKQCLPLSVAATVTFLAYKLYKNRTKQPTIDDALLPPLIKGAKPIIGNLLDLQKDPAKYLDNAKNTYGPCFRIAVPGQGKLCVVTGPLIGEVMKSTKNFSFTQGIETLVPAAKVVQISYQHKFVVENISPREKHPIVYPIKHNFKENQIDVFSERIQAALKHALDQELDLNKGEERVVDVWDTLTVLISNISCPCFAGSKVGNDKELIAGMAQFTQKIIKAGIFLSVLPTWLGNFVVRRFFSVEYEMDLIMTLLVPELEKIRNGQAGDDYEVTFASMALNLPKEDGSARTVQDAAYYFNNIALASIHTTSHFASFALHELACRPTLIRDLRNEVATLGNNRTPESVAKLPLMDSFFREVLRVDTDFLGMHHLALQDTTISTGQVIPKGSLVVGALEQIHRDIRFLPVDEETGEVFMGERPLEEFDAYRYVGKKIKSTTVGLDHLTFGLGAHACPGRFFAANEIKYVLAEMLVRYDVKTKTGKRAPDNVLLGMTRFPPREPLIFTGL
ncbi:hypothetical protein HMPREF1544_09518 [Mucor circinelloides 1006PhL]|uniref:Cytochrome P450 n=1 Tax=Mucor circinelloides f. circinelloides (strain 1006PhL) TaxID=1220926 RepID=S2J252_MUCC1|nr:hypothetical protein HMPREF1544_09518 [Mucor circinelloides 1006PhL]